MTLNRNARIGAFIGNVLHHYDSSLFGWTAPFLAPLLFPAKSGIDALVMTFALLPLSYIARPVGAFFWGWIGDRLGRKPALLASLTGMAAATFAIGCLPLIANAWIFLALCRLLQGFFGAGEEKGAALYLMEHTKEEKRPWMSAVYDASGILGIFLASLLATIFGETHWRELYWLGSLTALLGIFLRSYGTESPDFKPSRVSSWKVLWQERACVSKIAIVSGFSYANYYLITVFMNGFLPKVSGISREETLAFNTHLLWADFALLLGFGWLCKKVSKEKMMATAAFLAALFAIPLFASLEGANWYAAAFVRMSLVVLGVALAAPYHAWKLEIMPEQHRFLIGNMGSTLGSKFFGAPMPALATWMFAQSGHVWIVALPIVVSGFAAGAVLVWSPRKVLVRES